MGSKEKGFSLIELMVAMTVTLIITGAVFQLVTAGKSAFRREPEMADRQQNIRVAMDLISQDVYRAGYGAPGVRAGLHRQPRRRRTDGLGGAATDVLEMFGDVRVRAGRGLRRDRRGSVITTTQMLSACYQLPVLVMLADELKWAHAVGGEARRRDEQLVQAGSGGAGSDENGHVDLPAGPGGHREPARGLQRLGSPPHYMLAGQAVRYRINPEADGVPNLERSAFGGQTGPQPATARGRSSRGASRTCRSSTRTAAGWHDEPGADQLRRELRRARRGAVRHAHPPGARPALGAGDRRRRARRGRRTARSGSAVRGQLVTEIAPRAGRDRPRDVQRRPVGGPPVPGPPGPCAPEWADERGRGSGGLSRLALPGPAPGAISMGS